MWQVCVTARGLKSMPAGLLPEWVLGPLSLHPHLSCLANLYPALFLMPWEKDVCRCSVWAGVSCQYQAVLCFSGTTPGYTIIILRLFPSLPCYLLDCFFIVVIIKLKMLESSVISSNQNFWQHSPFWASICVRLWFNTCLSHYLHWEGRLRSVGLVVLALSLLQPRSAGALPRLAPTAGKWSSVCEPLQEGHSHSQAAADFRTLVT